MPILKPISGHTSCAGVYRYLTKNGRALARDFLNIDAPEEEGFDWAAVMDETRHAYRNDTPWGDRPARTYKHYVISPDPGDAVSLEGLRDLAIAWARENFHDYEVAIVYHDDNAGRIPHAGEFRSVLPALGVEVADNSAKAARRGWVYSMEGHPTWRISGERMGLGYGRQRKGTFRDFPLEPEFLCRERMRRIPAIKKPPEGGYYIWSRGLDLNQRPPGYEPGELPDCSTPQCLGAPCARVINIRTRLTAVKEDFDL